MNKYTPYLIVVAVVAVIILLIVMFSPKAKAAISNTGTGGASASSNTAGAVCAASFSGKADIDLNPLFIPGLNMNIVLKCGSYSMEVAMLQNTLGVAVDGKFGPQTETALQARYGKKEIALKEVMTIS